MAKARRKTKAKQAKKEPEAVCFTCGGENVQHAMWVYINTNRVSETFGTWNEYGATWCDDCEGHTRLGSPRDYKTFKREGY